MAVRKVNLPEDLLTSKSPDEKSNHRDASEGNNDEKALMGFLDDSKEQVTSESSIPLSPQWLYSKPNESKELRTPTSLCHGNSMDSSQKQVWRLDGSQDKKERRRNGLEMEGSRRWREEERETGLLGRRDRRKEGDRENEYRLSDRRADNTSNKENTESRDKWHDVPSRTSGTETRRDSKWSSRWGPEDKEDSHAEKRIDAEKEDPHNEKQYIGNNRVALDNGTDSRDKWRPRHRQEIHSSGSTVYRAAPGFGLDRGRVDGSNVGFALGRGRSNPISSRPSSGGPIGAVPGNGETGHHGKCIPSTDTFSYPRGKLLDIYRKHKLVSSFHTVPDEFEEVPPITQLSPKEPLAFVAPDAEEEAILDDISKGKIKSSRANYTSTRDKMGRVNNNERGDDTWAESKHGVLPTNNTEEAGSILGEHENRFTAQTGGMDSGGKATSVSKSNNFSSTTEPGNSHIGSKHEVADSSILADDLQIEHATSFNCTKLEDVESAANFEIGTRLPDDSNSLFDGRSLLEITDTEQKLKSDGQEKQLGCCSQPEELSFFYRDPQGEIQGPFLGVDIISWFEQGFFGTDLPVCLAEASEGTPFQELGEVMPHLKVRAQSLSGIDSCNPEISDPIECNLEASIPGPDSTVSDVINEQQWPLHEFKGPSDHVQPRITTHEDLIEPHNGSLPPSGTENSPDIFNDERRHIPEIFANDAEEVFFPRRPRNTDTDPFEKQAGGTHDPLRNLTHNLLENDLGETAMLDHGGLKGNNLHPFGLSWSELEGAHLKHSLASNTSGAGEQGDLIQAMTGRDKQAHLIQAMTGRDTLTFGHKRNSFSVLPDPPVVGETWSNAYQGSIPVSSNAVHDAMDVHHLSPWERESGHLDLAEHVLAQQLQRQQLQQQNLLPVDLAEHVFLQQLQKQQLQQQNLVSSNPSMHLNQSAVEQLQQSATLQRLNSVHQQSIGQPLPDLDQLLKLQIQQRQQFQLQQQKQFQLQQQKQFQLQQQRQLQEQIHHHQLQLQQQQQQQQSQLDQLLLQKFLHHPVNDHSFGPPRVDNQINGMLEEALSRQQYLHELQQRSFPSRHPDPSLEQLIHAKFGDSLHPEHYNHLLELLTHEKDARMLSMDPQLLSDIQKEQLQVEQLMRHQQAIEEERHVGGAWSVDESGRFVRAAANLHQTHSSGFSPSDFYHQQQRPSSSEHRRNLDRNLALHELQRSVYEPSSLPFERSLSLPAGSCGVNMDVANARNLFQGREIHEHAQIHSARQMDPFSSRIHWHGSQIANQFPASSRDLLESQLQQVHLETEQKKRDSEVNLMYEDLSSWVSTVGNDGNSKQAVAELFHREMSIPSSHSLELGEGALNSSHGRRDPSWDVSSSGLDNPYDSFTGQEGLGDPFAERPLGFNLVHPVPEQMANKATDEKASSIRSSGSMQFLSNSGKSTEKDRFFLGISEKVEVSNMADKPSMDEMNLLELEDTNGMFWGSKSKVGNVPVGKGPEAPEKAGANVADGGELLGYSPSGPRRALLSSTDLRRHLSGNPKAQMLETSVSSKKEMRFIRTLPCSETDAAEPSFIDMLKKPPPETDVATTGAPESSDTSQTSKCNNKKKGKKGRQIDPALLGFKVSSNRIMMGEIQRLDE